MKIFLVGFMGAGKTTVGEILARRLEVPFVDLDREIEGAAGLSVREIFLQRGEPEFRQLEREALKTAAALPDAVIATGGGTIAVTANAELMKSGLTVWLNPTFATLAARIGGAGKMDRPLFRSETQALALYRERLPAYRTADLAVDVGPEEAPEEIAARILLRMPTR
ncbi:MAG TPA: shikimate kinase [Thermoanaerobaculia bacterium]|nr:shikimate kinase [Thermoanaerobaculia bacterium]